HGSKVTGEPTQHLGRGKLSSSRAPPEPRAVQSATVTRSTTISIGARRGPKAHGSTMNEIDRSYEWARRIARREAKNFYYGFLLLPYEKRRSLYAVYAYSRRLDDAVDSIEGDGPSALDEARRRLDGLRALIGETPPDDPLV